MVLLADGGGAIKAAPPPPPPPPPPPKTPAEQQKMDAAIAKAEDQREAAGGAADLKPTEIPHPVQPGDTLTGVSGTYKSPLQTIFGANPQIQNPNLINPGQVVFVPTTDQKTIDTRTKVAAAEAADKSVSSLEAVTKDPATPSGERKLAQMDLTTARSTASQAWGVVRDDAKAEIRDAGKTATFPVDQAVQPTVDEMRARAPESPGYQKAVTEAQTEVDKTWREQRTTGAQLDELTTAARDQDKAVASLEAATKDPATPSGERKLAQMDLADARSAASEKWNAVQSAAERELRFAGGQGVLPDQTAAPTTEALKAAYPNDAKFQQEITDAQKTVESEWRERTTTTSELSDLSANVQGAERNLASLEEMSRTGEIGERKMAQMELPTARQSVSEARTALRDEISADLRTRGEGKPYPEEATAGALDDIKSKLPNDPSVRGIADEAMTTVTDEWRAQGWTRDQLGGAVTAYDDAKAAQTKADEAKASDDPKLQALYPTLQASADQKLTDARDTLQSQVQGASDAVPAEQKEAAATARALILADNGPKDEAFQTLVDEAHTAVVVTPRVEAVSAAYDRGGAVEAANELDKQTAEASPETAQRVIDASLPTIDKISADLGKTAGDPAADMSWEDSAGIITDLSRATSKANLAPGAQETVDKVAQSLANNVPDIAGVGQPPYTTGVRQAVVDGGGSDLAVAMIKTANDRGQDWQADNLSIALNDGATELKEKTKTAVEDFRDATQTIVQLRTDWGGVMSPEQADAAITKYVEDHPEVLEDFNRTYAALESTGLAATRYARGVDDDALKALDGYDMQGAIKDVRNGLVNDDNSKIVMAESQPAKNEIVQGVLAAEVAHQSGGSGQQYNSAAFANQARGSVKEIANSLMVVSSASSAADAADIGRGGQLTTQSIQDVFSSRQIKMDPMKTTNFGGAMNGLGAAFNGLAASAAYENYVNGDGRLGDAIKAGYYSVGATKETAEALAVVTARGWLGPIGASPAVQRTAASVLAGVDRSGAGGLSAITKQPGWVKFGTFVKTVGTAIDAGYAIDSAVKGDYPAAGLYAASAGGGLLMTLSGAGAIGAWGGPVGAGVTVLAGAALWAYKDSQEKSKMEEPSREFLEAAGLKPEIAEKLADYDNNDGSSPGPVIASALAQFGGDRSKFIETMNRMDPDDVHDFAKAAWTVEPGDDGKFPVTSDTDRQVWWPGSKDPEYGGKYLYDPEDTKYRGTYGVAAGSPWPLHITEPNPRSLTAFKDYARALFGEGVVG